ncbi:MAG: hypothetical protein INH41_21060 [Myxococcaceae bacterium]|nr:hypothetical protein [Myxococcaceae bacterium]MCA3014883.1 hypothetical protein [Myxococcaceae bacterium]
MRALALNVVDPWGQQAFQWALDGWGIARVARRAGASAPGRELLARRPTLVLDLERLDLYPEGSFGRFLAEWFRAWRIAPFAPRRVPRSDLEYFVDRLFFTHDVWHALVGLGTDLRNELRFLAVLLSQYASGSAMVALFVGWLQLLRHEGLRAFLAMPYEAWSFFRWGRCAQDLCVVPWEALLAEPVESVRLRLLAPDRPRLGQWHTWPTPRIVLPARDEVEAGPPADAALPTT